VLVVVHSFDAVMQHFSFTDQISRTMSDNADKCTSFRELQSVVFVTISANFV